MNNRAVIYCRVSTDEQTTDNQLDVLKGWAIQRGLEIVAVYSETASAWTAGHQRELSRLMGDAYKRKFDTVLVWALDRISRQGALEILKFVHKMHGWGINILSYQESFTDGSPEADELYYAVAGWVARMESARRSERTKAGIERKRATGWNPGRPRGSKDKTKRKRRTNVPKDIN